MWHSGGTFPMICRGFSGFTRHTPSSSEWTVMLIFFTVLKANFIYFSVIQSTVQLCLIMMCSFNSVWCELKLLHKGPTNLTLAHLSIDPHLSLVALQHIYFYCTKKCQQWMMTRDLWDLTVPTAISVPEIGHRSIYASGPDMRGKILWFVHTCRQKYHHFSL